MTQLFIALYRFFRSHVAVCWLTMAALFAFFGYFALQLHLEEDIDKLMPSSKNEDGTTKLAFADLKIKDKTFLLFAAVPDIQRSKNSQDITSMLTEVCDAFADSLAQDSLMVEDLFYHLDEDLMANGIDYLTDHLPAYIDTTAYAAFDTLLTREHMLQQMQQNRDDLEGEFGQAFPELIELDPIGMRSVLMQSIAPLMQTGGAYRTIDNHFFVPDSTVCIAFLTPRFSSTNTGQGSALFERLNQLIGSFRTTHPDVDITYHGTPASGYYNSHQIKNDLTTTIAGAMILVLLFLLMCFWNGSISNLIVFPLLLLLPVAFGTFFGMAMMYWIKGEFSLLALGIGGVVLGVALSYVLHVLTHRQYVGGGEQLLRDQVKPVLLGCITTIGSFAGLLFINTDLLRDFGLFAAFAILGTTLFSLTYLPQLAWWANKDVWWNGKELSADREEKGSFPAFIDRFNNAAPDRKPWLIAIIVIITTICVGAYLWKGTQFDADMHNLGYLEEMTERSEQLLRDKTYSEDKTKYFASKGATMEEALEHFNVLNTKLDSLQQLGLVKSYTPTNQIFIPLKVQKERIEAWHQYWTQERLATARTLITATAPTAGLKSEAFDTFFDATTRDYEADALYQTGIIPQGYQSTMMEQSYGGDWLCFTSVRCLNDEVRSSDSDYMRICDAIAQDPNLLVLDTYYYTTDTLMQMSRDFDILQWLSMAFVFIVLLMSFRFNVRLTLLGFLPILLSWLIVLGAMVIFGVRFNLISIIISTFIFGIGVDYSIFVMNGLTAGESPILKYHKTAIFFSAVTLVVTVSSMLMASHPAIRSVGFATLVGLLSAVILSYVLQPAIYRKIRNKL